MNIWVKIRDDKIRDWLLSNPMPHDPRYTEVKIMVVPEGPIVNRVLLAKEWQLAHIPH